MALGVLGRRVRMVGAATGFSKAIEQLKPGAQMLLRSGTERDHAGRRVLKLQEEFSWREVAISAAAAGASGLAGRIRVGRGAAFTQPLVRGHRLRCGPHSAARWTSRCARGCVRQCDWQQPC